VQDEVTPENINEKGYKFSLVVNGTKRDERLSFKLAIETKDGGKMADGTSVALTIERGGKIKVFARLECVKGDKKIEVKSFDLSSDMLSDAVVDFDISPGLAPSGTGYKFQLSKFVKP